MRKDKTLNEILSFISEGRGEGRRWIDIKRRFNLPDVKLFRYLTELKGNRAIKKIANDKGKLIYIAWLNPDAIRINELIEYNKFKLKKVLLLKELDFFSKGMDSKKILEFLQRVREYSPSANTAWELHKKLHKEMTLTPDLLAAFQWEMVFDSNEPLEVTFSMKKNPNAIIKEIESHIKYFEDMGKKHGKDSKIAEAVKK